MNAQNDLPPELQRAVELTDDLHKAVSIAIAMKQEKICFDAEKAKELVQLLNDSVKTAKQLLNAKQRGMIRA